MIHDILQSDIELAVRLREDQRPDEEILQTLMHRGIEAGKAAQLLDDLRSGRKVSAAPAPSEFAPRRRTRTERHPKEEPVSAPAPAPERHSARESRSRHRGRAGSQSFRGLFLFLVGLAVVVVACVVYWRFRTPVTAPQETGPTPAKASPASPSTSGAANVKPSGSTTSLALELRSDGLHVGGSLVTRDNVLPAVAGLLGAPSRTNVVAGTGVTVYAYDPQGVLVYVQPGGRTNSIMLDCDATGGANGTTSAFTGTLKLEDQVIGPETDAKTLGSLKRLGLRSIKSDGSIWGGHYNTLELVFAYLKSPRRLSLIEIDLE
jgi:hypothetical protein